MPIDPIVKKVSDTDIRSLMERTPGLSEAWQKGKIEDLIKFGVVGIQKEDLERFAADQFKKLMEEVVKPDDIRAVEASAPPPMFEKDFTIPYSAAKVLSVEDKAEATKILTKSMKGAKASADGGSGGSTDDYQQALNYLDSVMGPKIVEMQFQQQMEAKSSELQAELDRIIAMIKSGEIEDPTILLLALCKVNVERGGLVFTQLGERMKNLNERMNLSYEALKGDPPVASMYTAQQEIKTGGQSMQFLMNDMQKVMQYIDGNITSTKSAMDLIKSGKDEMIRKIAAQG